MCSKLNVSVFRLRVPDDALIPLTKRDESKLSSLLKRPYVTSQPDWQKEVREGKGRTDKVLRVTDRSCVDFV